MTTHLELTKPGHQAQARGELRDVVPVQHLTSVTTEIPHSKLTTLGRTRLPEPTARDEASQLHGH